MRISLLALTWILATASLHAAAPVVEIAVISDADSRDLAALVVADLSPHPGIKLVERDALDKIGDELKLQQLAGADAVALGKTIQADGLLFLDRQKDSYQIRFTGVGLGYILFNEQIPAATDLPTLSKSLVHRVSNYVPKLKLDPNKAIPVSVLNLRADYATAESSALERNLTLLLEERLAAVPEFVVLERRHSWFLGFERNIAAEERPLLQAACLIDGSLGFSPASEKYNLVARLRRPDGTSLEISANAGRHNLPSLADQVVEGIQKALAIKASPPPTAPNPEAAEYFSEGVWAWRSNSPEAAVEALDSCELLGGPLPDITAVRNYALCAIVEKGIKNYAPWFGDSSNIPKLDQASMATRLEAALRAINDMARFRDEKFAEKLMPETTKDSGDEYYFRTDRMRSLTIARCSKLLFLLDYHQFSGAEQLRQALRLITEYDPLHGKPGLATDANMNNYIARSYFSGTWAQSMEEELAFYRLVCNDKDVALPDHIEDRFCFRFLKTKEERTAKFEEFVASLPDTEDYRFSKLLLQTRLDNGGAATEACAKLLSSFWDRREDLPKNGKIYGQFRFIPSDVKIANAPKAVPLLQYLLVSPEIDWRGLGILYDFWVPVGFPEEAAPGLWAALLQCKGSLRGIWQSKGFNMSHLDRHLNELDIMERDFRNKFPKIAALPSQKSADPDIPTLTVSKFWSPWQVPDSPKGSYFLLSWLDSPDGLWVMGFFSGVENTPRVFYHIDLKNFTSQKVDSPNNKFNPMRIALDSEALYFLSDPGGNSEKKSLSRYLFKTSSWETQELPDFHTGDLFNVLGTLYFFTKAAGDESSIIRYNWDTKEWKILASSRRRPAKNQFDDSSPVDFHPSIFAGPKGKPCITFIEGTYYIREEDGPWPEVFNGAWGQAARSVGNQTLVGSQNGEVVMLSPDKTEPEFLAASYEVKFRKRGSSKDTHEKAPTPWKAENPWALDFGKNSTWNERIGFYNEDLYLLKVPEDETPLFLLCYRSGDPGSPYRIPLRFQLDAATKSALSALPEKSFIYGFSMDDIENPHKMPNSKKYSQPGIFATRQGLCIRYITNGFWFLPFEDIDAFLKAHPETSQTKSVR